MQNMQLAVPSTSHGTRPTHLIRLNGDNYSTWRMVMKKALSNRKLASVVYDPEDPLLSAEERSVKDSEAWELLITTMDQATMDKVVVCETAREIWDRLKNIFEQEGDASLTNNYIQFFTITMHESEEVSDYISKLEKLVDKITQQGETLSDRLQQANLLRGLTSDYDVFRKVWSGTAEKSYKILKDRLILEGTSNKNQQSRNKSGSAFYSREQDRSHGKDRRQDNDKRKEVARCKFCNYRGHTIEDCRRKKAQQDNNPPQKTNNSPNAQKSNHQQSSNPKPNERAQSRSNNNFAFMAKVGDQYAGPDLWYADSGASKHMCNNKAMFSTITYFDTPIQITIGDATTIKAYGSGPVDIESTSGGAIYSVTLTNVYYVPEIAENLISISATTSKGKVRVIFDEDHVLFFSKTEQPVLIARGNKLPSGLYLMEAYAQSDRALFMKFNRTIDEWHSSLAHINKARINRAITGNLVEKASILDKREQGCCECPQGKGTQVSHPDSHRELAKEVGNVAHMDLVGKTIPSLGGSQYFLLITDEASNYRVIYPIKTKDQVRDMLRDYLTMVRNQTGNSVKHVFSDNGSEFVNQWTKELFAVEQVLHHTSAPRTPEQNGRAERSNRTVIEATRTMLLSSGLPKELWAEAAVAAVYILNRISKVRDGDTTPFEMWFRRKPHIAHIHVFGQEIQLVNKERPESKWASRTTPAYLVGYTERENTYRCFIPGKRAIAVTSDVIFEKHPPKTTCHCQTTSSIGPTPDFLIIPDNKPRENTANNPITDDPGTTENSELNVAPSPNGNFQSTPLVTADNRSSDLGRKLPTSVLSDYFNELLKHDGQHSAVNLEEKDESKSITRPEISLLTDHEANNTSGQNNNVNTDNTGASTSNQQGHPGRLSRLLGLSSSARINNAIVTPSRQAEVDHQPFKDGRLSDLKLTKGGMSGVFSLIAHIEPKTYDQALKSKECDKWQTAIDDERKSLEENQTWTVVKLPKDGHALSSRWVFTKKMLSNGEVDRYKARLVVRGFTQRPGVDFHETFAPVVHLESIRILFALITHYRMEILQFDIATAFLQGDLDEDIYIAPPKGIDCPNNHVLKLNKSIYGLKQAPRCWKSSFDRILSRLNFEPMISDPCLFVGNILSHKVLLAIYVDDGLAASKSREALDHLLKLLSTELKVREVKSNKFVGIEIKRSDDYSELVLHQQAYIYKMLDEFNMISCKPDKTPITDTKALQTQDANDKVTTAPYRELIGSLLYAACLTRPDISFAVSFLSRFSEAPLDKHWAAAKRILRYLKGTAQMGIKFTHSTQLNLECFTDADWGGDLTSRKSTSGMICFLSNGPISFKSKKQTVVAQSTTEAEYLAANLGVREILGTRNILDELDIQPNTTSLNLDNQSAIRLIKNSEYHNDTKHISIKAHFIRDHYQQGMFSLQYVSSSDQKADILTKALAPKTHTAMLGKLNMTLIAVVCIITTLIAPMDGHVFAVDDPIIWMKENVHYISGQIDEHIRVELIDQCQYVFKNLTGLNNLDNKLMQACSQRFKLDVIENWKKIASDNTRIARDGGLSLATVVAVTSIFTSIAATIKVKDMEREERIRNELVTQMNDNVATIQRKLLLSNERISTKLDKLEDRIEKLGHIVAAQPQLQDALHQALIAIHEYKLRLLQLKRQLTINSEVPTILLEIFNLTHLTNEATLRHSKIHKIVMRDNHLHIQLTLPKIDHRVTIYKAKPFFYTAIHDDKVCTFRYRGPEYMMHNKSSGCMHPVSNDEIINSAIVGEDCTHPRSLNIKDLFVPEDCQKITKETFMKQKVQIKPYGVQVFVNCQGHNITIGNLNQRCPNHVFTVNEGVKFMVGDTRYQFEKSNTDVALNLHDVSARINLQLGTSKPIFTALDTEDIQDLEKEGAQLRKAQLKLKLLTNSTSSSSFFNFDLGSLYNIGSTTHWLITVIGSYLGMLVGVYILYLLIKDKWNVKLSTTILAIIAILPLAMATDQQSQFLTVTQTATESTRQIHQLQNAMLENKCNLWSLNENTDWWQRGAGYYPVSIACALARYKIECPCSVETEIIPVLPRYEIRLMRNFTVPPTCARNPTQEFSSQLRLYETLVEYLCISARQEPDDAWPKRAHGQLVASGCMVAKMAYNCHCPGNHKNIYNDVIATTLEALRLRGPKPATCKGPEPAPEKSNSVVDHLFTA